jgi:mannose-6-phosphate isomerase-like protein (cupin superfamily)
MPDVTSKRFDEMEATFRGSMRKVRAELGLTSFGVQIMDLLPDSAHHPWHHHVKDRQEEMYLALQGSGVLELESGERFPLERDRVIRVGAAERRRVLAGPDGIRMLIVGGIPGQPYEPWHRTELGAPDPLAD